VPRRSRVGRSVLTPAEIAHRAAGIVHAQSQRMRLTFADPA
jgi:hypothetical protein